MKGFLQFLLRKAIITSAHNRWPKQVTWQLPSPKGQGYLVEEYCREYQDGATIDHPLKWASGGLIFVSATVLPVGNETNTLGDIMMCQTLLKIYLQNLIESSKQPVKLTSLAPFDRFLKTRGLEEVK